MTLDELRDQHCDRPIGILIFQLSDQLQQRRVNASIGSAHENQLRRMRIVRSERGLFDVRRPLLAQLPLFPLHVRSFEHRQMNRRHIGRKLHGEAERLVSQSIPFPRRDQHDRRLARAKFEWPLVPQMLVDVVVITLDRLEQQDDARNGDDRDPAAPPELGDHDDHERRYRCRCADSVDNEMEPEPPASRRATGARATPAANAPPCPPATG